MFINLIECQPQCVYANPHITLTSLSNEKITIENSFLAFLFLLFTRFGDWKSSNSHWPQLLEIHINLSNC